MVIQDVKRINKLTSNLSVECSLDLWCLECLGEWDEVLDGVLVLLGLNILVLSEEDLDDVFEWLSTFSDWLRAFPKKSQKLSAWIFNINTNETKDHNFSKMFVSALKKWLYNSIDPPPILLNVSKGRNKRQYRTERRLEKVNSWILQAKVI